ncbi:MAG: hypothetical protein EOL88_06155 [Bacteroidia bacterium]|nr:hypothetical protein [Bacteroidia bacterium]
MKKRINLYVDVELLNYIINKSKERNKTMTDIITEALLLHRLIDRREEVKKVIDTLGNLDLG